MTLLSSFFCCRFSLVQIASYRLQTLIIQYNQIVSSCIVYADPAPMSIPYRKISRILADVRSTNLSAAPLLTDCSTRIEIKLFFFYYVDFKSHGDRQAITHPKKTPTTEIQYLPVNFQTSQLFAVCSAHLQRRAQLFLQNSLTQFYATPFQPK